ncbi:SRP40, C-terminal domain-containing protein [Pavlovales sp. CCMP2436]|nr:SRP40, C-terminal domain-containing protein [Pavlovales sp. CCMP2436]
MAKMEVDSSSDESSDDSDDSSEEAKLAAKPAAEVGSKRKAAVSSDSSDDDSSDSSDPEEKPPPAKKQAVAVADKPAAAEPLRKQGNTPFKRVDETEAEFYNFDARLKDNSFDAMRNSTDVGKNYLWGAKASEDLLKVKGKDFRKAKDKKKKGTYTGGEIDCTVNSVKFPDSDDEK